MKLGIDFGTWYSSAALCDDRGHIDFIEDPFDHGYSIPSSVFFTEDSKFLIGSAAENSRRMDPGRYCRDNIKLMGIGSREPIHLGNQTFSAEQLVAKILAWFKQEADKKAIALGYSAFEGVTLTVPALWRDHRRSIMNKAAVLAGFDETQVIILEEPVAAAISFATQSQITEEETILIYDLGGGTFDAALVQRQGANYLTLGMDGLFDCGGVHFNRKIYQWIKGQANDALGILLDRHNNTAEAIRLRSNIGDECNNTKCQLSATQQTQLSVSGNSGQLDCYPLTRSEFTDMIANDLDRTIDCCRRVIKAAGFSTEDISRVLLIGGSCRIPAVKQWVEKTLGLEAVLAPQLELSICSGAALYLPGRDYCLSEHNKNKYKSTDIATIKKQANNGHADAQAELGSRYYDGKGIKRDYSLSLKWFRCSSEKGNTDGLVGLADHYFSGIVIKQDKERAFQILEEVADEGNLEAKIRLILLNCSEKNRHIDTGEAMSSLQNMSKQDHPSAQYLLGFFLVTGDYFKQNIEEGLSWLEKAAGHGYEEAQIALADIYAVDQWGIKNIDVTLQWLRKAAKQGSHNAEYRLGGMYYQGMDVTRNNEEALKWLHKSAEQGNEEALFMLAGMYLNGDSGVHKDRLKSSQLMKKAAENGHLEAQYNLAHMYFEGVKHTPRIKEGKKWLMKSAANGFADAQNDLGMMFANGKYIHKDIDKAIELLKKAADQGNFRASFNLGYMYGTATAITKKKQINQTIYWFEKIEVIKESGIGDLLSKLRNNLSLACEDYPGYFNIADNLTKKIIKIASMHEKIDSAESASEIPEEVIVILDFWWKYIAEIPLDAREWVKDTDDDFTTWGIFYNDYWLYDRINECTLLKP